MLRCAFYNLKNAVFEAVLMQIRDSLAYCVGSQTIGRSKIIVGVLSNDCKALTRGLQASAGEIRMYTIRKRHKNW